LFSTDIVQALAYLMPGLALLVPAYWFRSEAFSAALQRLGSITAVVLIVPAAFSVGIFLHSVSALVQTKAEQSLRMISPSGLDLTERAVRSAFNSDPRLATLADGLSKAFKVEVKPNDLSGIYIYSRTLMTKDGSKTYDRTQFYSAVSVFCRSLILVSLIIAATALWRLGLGDIRRSIVVIVLLAGVSMVLFYAKEMHFRLSVHEAMRAALLLTADKR
jgi:hypothetical protein